MSTVSPEMCKVCCGLDLTCCNNPRIPWTMRDYERLKRENPMALMDSTIGVFKGKVSGVLFIANQNQKGVHTSCVFYSKEKMKCKIYASRPAVCRTYGEDTYNPCPYHEYDEEGLVALRKTDYDKCLDLHDVVPPEKAQDRLIKDYFSDVLTPEQFIEWDSFVEVNWVDKGDSDG